MPSSWTIEFVRKFGGRLSIRSLMRLRSALIAERRGKLGMRESVRLRMRSPGRLDIVLRPASNDIYTFDEVFIEEVYGHVFSCLGDAGTVIDLGANIGLASLLFLTCYPRARLFAVEPDPGNYEMLRSNLRPFVTAGRAATLQAAFWKSDCGVVFEAPAQPGHVNQGAVRDDGGTLEPSRRVQVDGLTMRSIIDRSGFDSVDLLKVDVEGAEEHLFSGDSGWLGKVRCMALEFHDDTRRSSDFDAVARGNGFTVVDSQAHTVIAFRPGLPGGRESSSA
jgi:FkbM family methyltransferase